ncbi:MULTISPECIES: PaaX family transcriptional regulator C-terminal domain-containing protein [Streptosporangium]|uniref:Phenylacetic acid degradation operon negative regulatory protein n=1 Tax=Streptosporangium brasiliense TaxID=47480 RepID=A0ABT9RDA2_9ACTN|nr:PaaX family transcriptional regulator C-terminal domain-containing protein [Streptosporangium brasiliense]MDP9867225.1 phenylacetic acid degradation operon negative regulatory protein [Streptosporangium brasiliense]
MTYEDDLLGLRPMTARSVILSTLLGTHPPRLRAGHLVRVGALFGIPEGTVRVALSRMVAAGDVAQREGHYELSERLRLRQARQDESRSPGTRRWDGGWEVAIVTAERRPAAERAALREAMAALRLAEIREGVWMRPDNLRRARPPVVAGQCAFLRAVPEEDPAALAGSLWDLPGWARHARALQGAFDAATTVADRFALAAAALRHLLADPLLPAGLLPGDWPGDGLRHRYDLFETEFGSLVRDHL